MPIAACFLLPRAAVFSRPSLLLPPPSPPGRRRAILPEDPSSRRHRRDLLVAAASSASFFDGLDSKGKPEERCSPSSKSILLKLIQDIEPLDVAVIQKDVPANTVDAMKRTVSGMLGLLPSDQFLVLVEAFWEPLFKLFVSSVKTGYTLCNAEYRLCLERNLDTLENTERRKQDTLEDFSHEMLIDWSAKMLNFPERSGAPCNDGKNEDDISCDNMNFEGLGDITPAASQYICYIQSRLNSVQKELHEIKKKYSASHMKQLVGEEKNDLLDYLRSLQPEKVAELSEPTCPCVEEAIYSVARGLCVTLSPKMHSNPPQSDNGMGGTLSIGEDCTELPENTSIQFQPLISVPRDYLARLLFWCMLLGHHIRSLEYRLEMVQLLTITRETDSIA